ncbi:MAG: hypothetical protein F3743_07380 [Nitrospinae bacterium]|nr:hypothetical protein [Nitrospinota bacterium]MZH05208.1 hypothetical protein [Nitrospinota bacterium]MZH15561.1 hypothetical protein [Nitrospinota bacterium]
MPCKDTTSQISILLDKRDHLIDFDYSKNTCNKEVGGGTGFREFCIGKPVDVLSELEFDDLVNILGLDDSENQFLLYLEWSALSAALDQYQGRLVPKEEERYQIATIAYESDQVEIRQMVLAPSEMPKIIPCRKR